MEVKTNLKRRVKNRSCFRIKINSRYSILCRNFYFRTSHVPAFGSWDVSNEDLPFTQCFESARQAEALRCRYSGDRDLYVAGDLYENDVVTPAVIVVPRRRRGKAEQELKENKTEKWGGCGCECEFNEVTNAASAAKAVDEDLYKISPQLLAAHNKRKKGWGFLSICLRPTCVY